MSISNKCIPEYVNKKITTKVAHYNLWQWLMTHMFGSTGTPQRNSTTPRGDFSLMHLKSGPFSHCRRRMEPLTVSVIALWGWCGVSVLRISGSHKRSFISCMTEFRSEFWDPKFDWFPDNWFQDSAVHELCRCVYNWLPVRKAAKYSFASGLWTLHPL